MGEYEIRVPHAGSTLEELQRTYEDLIALEQLDENLMAEVLQAMGDSEPMPAWPPSPFPESSQAHRTWCAAQFAMEISDYQGAMAEIEKLGPRSSSTPRLQRPRRR